MTVNEVIERLEQFEKIYGKNTPVMIENNGLLQEIDGVWIDKYMDIIVLEGG